MEFEREDGVMTVSTADTRELAVRESDGIHVVLSWNPDGNALTVSVEDGRVGDRFSPAVALDRALAAFYHPYA